MVLMIGIGNPLRQDDGAGWALAARLADALHACGQPCRVLTMQQLTPEIAVEVAADGVTAVCFVDVAIDAPGLRLLPLDTALAAPDTRITHEIGPRTLLAYAGILRGSLPAAWLLTVGGTAFTHGEGLSLNVQSALADDATLHAFAQRLCATPCT